ncbi:glycosyltransferase family 4 protein [Prochlorococcus sp. AH-716-O13]|nr:glycosyltransferase family 4 protein [Prochlorococcus sp. AH-716-O13]
MSKKILFNITEDWFFCSHFLQRALAAKKTGYKVYVCCNHNKHKSTIESYGIKIFHVPYLRKNINPFFEFLILLKIIFVYFSIKPDLVHHVAAKPIIYGSIAAKICRIRAVLNAPVGLGFVFTSKRIKAKFLRPILKVLMKSFLNTHHGENKTNKVVFENNDDLNFFFNLGALRRTDACVIRGAGVKINKLVIKKKSSKIVIVTLVARMIEDKGIYEFVAAAKKIKKKNTNVRFLLVGDVDKQNPSSLNKKTLIFWNKRKIIEWLGWVDNVNEVLEQTDVLCLPSYREGLPKALLEGAARGLPIVTTDTVGCRDVVEDGLNGFLVPVRNIDQLALKIEELVKDNLLREKMGKESFKLAKNKFSEEIINTQTLEIYNELTN